MSMDEVGERIQHEIEQLRQIRQDTPRWGATWYALSRAMLALWDALECARVEQEAESNAAAEANISRAAAINELAKRAGLPPRT